MKPFSWNTHDLYFMDNPQAPPVGTKGTVEFVDDAGMIHMHWETGSSLGLAPGEDSFHKM